MEQTLGIPSDFDGPSDKIIDYMCEEGAWCIGTPDDLVDFIHRLDEDSGGFGGVLIQAQEWGTREQVDHSYELVARYVAPRFQGSLQSLDASQMWSAAKRSELEELKQRSLERAQADYESRS